jgi:N-acyl-L-homoserine lactone synthetase
MSVIGGKTGTLPATVFSQMAGYRHQAANALAAWQPPGRHAHPDRFDGDDAVYVVSQDDTGRVNGCARLLPTVKPYPLREVCPELMQGAPLPASDEVWELSQFSAADFNQRSGAAVTALPCDIAIVLLREALACAARHGAKRVLTVAPISFERLIRRAGLHAHRAGPPLLVDGHPVFACWIEIDAG